VRKKPQADLGKIEQAIDGKAHRYHLREDGTAVAYTICCSCNLVHLEEFKPMKTYIRVRVWREDGMTEKLRKRYKKRKLK
jgi:hypothetical protein